jgi:hypothetical protein
MADGWLIGLKVGLMMLVSWLPDHVLIQSSWWYSYSVLNPQYSSINMESLNRLAG